MENITLGEVVSAIGVLTVIIGAIVKIVKFINKSVNERNSLVETLRDYQKTLEDRFENIDNRLIAIDEASCKNFLVRYLRDVENGLEMDPVETERAYEIYDRYINVLHKNSYIHAKWDKLMDNKSI